MIISIQSICRKDKIRQDGMVLVYLRFTYNRERRYVSTGIYIQTKDWDFDNQRLINKNSGNEREQIPPKDVIQFMTVELLDILALIGVAIFIKTKPRK